MEEPKSHRISESEKQEIKKKAKKLLDEFSKKIDKIRTKEKHFENNSGSRKEGDGWETDKEFRATMFCNAPDADDNFIIAEKGGWK